MRLTKNQRAMLARLVGRGDEGIPTRDVSGTDRVTLHSLGRRGLAFYVCEHLQISTEAKNGGIDWHDVGAIGDSFRYLSRQALRGRLADRPHALAEFLPTSPADFV
jgi:hypothetical protein